MQNLDQVINMLNLEKIDDQSFVGENFKTPWGRVFGGQVLGQALHAAYQTVPPDRFAHSMHGYFILGGNIDIPIRYEVDTIRDGGSFTTRRVVAFQNDKAIFNMAASFQLEQKGFEHQVPMPNVLPPEVILDFIDQLEALKDYDPKLYRRFSSIHPIAFEFRHVEKNDYHKPTIAYQHIWILTREKGQFSLAMQHQLLACVSDFNLLATAFRPHQAVTERSSVFFASLDHAIWFHRDFDISDWLLIAMDSPSASNARGFSRGTIFDKNGKLVSSVVQEGLMRAIK